MSNQHISWIDQLEQLIQEHHMLASPFYQAWTAGTLTKATLQEYAKEYYQHVKAFPTYISTLHSRCEDPEVRRALLTNLMDEEAGDPNHLELWASFAVSVGVDRSTLEAHQPKEFTKALINHFRTSCSLLPITIGLAALYSYESQIPAICKTKIDGLKKWYGITDPEGYRYFSEHETADVEHAAEERQLLLSLVPPGQESAILESAAKTLSALREFLGSFQY